jgi:hypothetical protein
MGAFPVEESELSERDISNVVRVDSSTKLMVSSSSKKLFYDDYYLKVLAYHQEYLI